VYVLFAKRIAQAYLDFALRHSRSWELTASPDLYTKDCMYHFCNARTILGLHGKYDFEVSKNLAIEIQIWK